MIDLHMHTTCSDGTETVEELIDNVLKMGIDYFAITDHDTALACRKVFDSENLKSKIKENNATFVPGVEFTCVYNTRKVHILAYDIDPFSKEVLELEQKLKNLLKEKDDDRKVLLEKDGYKLSAESLAFLNERINIRTPDMANCLVNDGYFDTLDNACSYLKSLKYARQYLYDAVEVIEKMSKSGAKVVWAHPFYGVGQKPLTIEQVEEFAKVFKDLGMVGLECYYSLYNKEQIDMLRNLAKNMGLYITCGSDYHGKNKTVKLANRSIDGSYVDENEIKIIKIFKNTVN